jgi:hypothetical protein
LGLHHGRHHRHTQQAGNLQRLWRFHNACLSSKLVFNAS